MFEVKNLTIKIDNRILINNLSFTLNKGDKLAIIGEEGNGKSTLLKAFINECSYAEITGTINSKNYKIGYLEQTINDNLLDISVNNFLFIDGDDYYNKINNFYKYLELINLNDDILKQTINTLSGGEKVKIRILKLLLEEYDILFLDEPTNDLDIKTLEWLEQFINTTDKPIIFISHDEVLLSNTANQILHIEQIKKKTEAKHTYLKTTYDEYVNMRFKALEKQRQIAKNEKREYNKKQEKLNKVMQSVESDQRNISRADPHGARLLKKKMHSLKAQEKKIIRSRVN